MWLFLGGVFAGFTLGIVTVILIAANNNDD